MTDPNTTTTTSTTGTPTAAAGAVDGETTVVTDATGKDPDRLVTTTADGTVVISPDYEWRVGPFIVSTSLFGEREIDVDDRGAIIEFAIEMTPVGDWQLLAEDLDVTLNYDFESVNVAIGGELTGPLPILKAKRLRPGQRLTSRQTVTTGIFSSIDRAPGRPSAPAGAHNVTVEIDYRLVQDDSVDNKASGYVPIIVAED